MLDVIGRLTTRHAWWVVAFWTAALAALILTRQDPFITLLGVPGPGLPGAVGSGLLGGYGPVPGGGGGMVAAGVVLFALAAVLRSPLAVPLALLAAVAVHGMSAVVVSALGLPAPPALFAYGTALGCAVMMVHRFKERLSSGDGPAVAVQTCLDRVGPVVATAYAAWTVSCGALPLGAGTRGLGPALAVTASAGILVALTLLPALLTVLAPLLAWPSRRRPGPRKGRPSGPRKGGTRLGLAVAAHPAAWTPVAAGLILAMGATGPVLVPAPLPAAVVAVAGVLVALVLALVLRSLVSPAYVASGALLVAWAAGTTAARPGDQLAVFMFTLAVTVSTALLVLARVREATGTGRDPRTSSALAIKYAGPPALAALLVAGTLAATVYDVLSGVCLVAGGAALSLVVVPGLTAMLGTRAWWPDTAPA
ncbi:MMPL family transporter [Sphaerisporangium corydalis]|uniref:MMPL family transporter n=1 Tax=Sphaerisporangium corydalis TaxID=1441875 RepID=A0ABV9ECH9_9ACTN|nr:MMPL family transporter [Sphaerisporangium corydalis]